MIDYKGILNKQGTALDFIIYVVASDAPQTDDTIHGFFFQKWTRRVHTPFFITNEEIQNNIHQYYSKYNITDDNKRKILNRVSLDRLIYYANELVFEKIENADFTDNYFEYIDSFIDITKYITVNDRVDFDSIEFIEEIYSKKEIEEILDNINFFLSEYDNYNEDTEEFERLNANTKKLTLSNLNEYFEEYVSLRLLLPNIFISYYASLVNFLSTKELYNIHKFVKEVEANINSPIINNVSSKVKYLETLVSENEKLLFKHSFVVPQLSVFFENSKPIPMVYESLWDYLNIHSHTELLTHFYLNGINLYVYKELDSEHSLYGMKLKYLNHLLFGERETSNDDLDDEFNRFADVKSNFAIFLKRKNFNVDEIRIILNALSENRYNEFGIKYLNLSRDIYFFRFCYFFYVFDYFEEIEGNELNTIMSFEDVVNFNRNNKRENKQQYHKNYININNPDSKDYPFATKKTDLFLSEIESTLGIRREKLKPIPEIKIN